MVNRIDFLAVKPSATQDDINKAYRKKSKQLHPDKVRRAFIANNSRQPRDKTKKNKKPGVHVSKGPSERQIANVVKEANERSARLNLAANILRGPSRERYDHFLNFAADTSHPSLSLSLGLSSLLTHFYNVLRFERLQFSAEHSSCAISSPR